jgi:hypothetical protein
MRKAIAIGAIVLSVGLAATGQFHYAFYYDLSGGQDLEINVMNTMPWANEIVIEVHDAYGGLIWDSSGTVDGYATAYVKLGKNVPSSDFTWGVVTVRSADRVIIGLEYFKEGLLISMDTVYNEMPTIDAGEPYWLGTYYTQVGDAETAFIVMNPWETTAWCGVTAYDADGASVYSQEFVLGPYESEYVRLGNEIGTGGLLYGLLDVQMEGQLVVLALEYTGRGCSGLEIDNVTEYYF